MTPHEILTAYEKLAAQSRPMLRVLHSFLPDTEYWRAEYYYRPLVHSKDIEVGVDYFDGDLSLADYRFIFTLPGNLCFSTEDIVLEALRYHIIRNYDDVLEDYDDYWGDDWEQEESGRWVNRRPGLPEPLVADEKKAQEMDALDGTGYYTLEKT